MRTDTSYWIDAHCHLADPRIDGAGIRDAMIERAKLAGIQTLLQGGVDPADWERQLALRAQYGDLVVPVFGAYPIWAGASARTAIDAALLRLEELLPGTCAVGEVGLDFRGPHDNEARKRQFYAFEAQLALAKSRSLPVVLHIVHAHPEALRILKASDLKQGGIVHSFTGNTHQASGYLELGFSISVGCGLLRNTASALREAVKTVPPEHLVIESDTPDQPPPNQGGALNEPTSILITASEIAKLRSTTPEEVLDRSSANLRKLFQLK